MITDAMVSSLHLLPFMLPIPNSTDVTTTLTNLIIDGVASHSSLLDSYVVLHAAFVSSLHKIIGVEFGENLSKVSSTPYDL